MGDGNTAGNTAARGRPFQRGADSRRGHGKRGRSGRHPDKIREVCRTEFSKRVKILAAIVDNEQEPAAVRIKAMETLGKYGLGTQFSQQDPEGNTLRSISVTHHVVDARTD